MKEIERSLGGTEMTTIGEANMKRYREKLLQQGLEQGMEQGLEQGRADTLARLREEVEQNFDSATAARVSKLIDSLD